MLFSNGRGQTVSCTPAHTASASPFLPHPPGVPGAGDAAQQLCCSAATCRLSGGNASPFPLHLTALNLAERQSMEDRACGAGWNWAMKPRLWNQMDLVGTNKAKLFLPTPVRLNFTNRKQA